MRRGKDRRNKASLQMEARVFDYSSWFPGNKSECYDLEYLTCACMYVSVLFDSHIVILFFYHLCHFTRAHALQERTHRTNDLSIRMKSSDLTKYF